MKITKVTLADSLYEAHPEIGSQDKAEAILRHVFDKVAEGMRAGADIEIRGVFTAKVKERKVPIGFASSKDDYTTRREYDFTVSGQARP